MSSDSVKKYPGQRWVVLLFTVGQKYARVGSGQGPSLPLTQGRQNSTLNMAFFWGESYFRITDFNLASTMMLIMTWWPKFDTWNIANKFLHHPIRSLIKKSYELNNLSCQAKILDYKKNCKIKSVWYWLWVWITNYHVPQYIFCIIVFWPKFMTIRDNSHFLLNKVIEIGPDPSILLVRSK